MEILTTELSDETVQSFIYYEHFKKSYFCIITLKKTASSWQCRLIPVDTYVACLRDHLDLRLASLYLACTDTCPEVK